MHRDDPNYPISSAHFFPTWDMVEKYNAGAPENSSELKNTVIAIDVPPADVPEQVTNQIMAALANRTKVQSMERLSHSITKAVNHQCDIIAHISVEDGIINGS